MTGKKEPSQEKQIRIMTISLMPAFVVLFSVGFYLLYREVSVWFYVASILSTAFGSLIVCFALNEFLLKIYGGQFKLKRLVFRWMLIALYVSPLMGAYLCLSTLFAWLATDHIFLLSNFVATGTFVIVILKYRNLFNRLDKGEW